MNEDETKKLERIFTEFHLGTAAVASFILHVLAKKGVLSGAEIVKAIHEATDAIPEQYAGDPRFAGISCLRVLLDDPEMRHTMPFDWPPEET